MINPMYKASTFIILTIILTLCFAVCEVWVIVDFLIYLVKDDPFNWLVFWLGIASLVLLLIVYAFSLIFAREAVKAKSMTTPKGPSRFQQRLHEAQENQRRRREGLNG